MDDKVVSNEGPKRRLPPWMLGDQARNKSETVILNSNDVDDEEEEGSRADEERIKKRGRRPKSKPCEIGNDDGSSLKFEEQSSSLLIKCRERKRKIREMVSHEVDIHGEVAIEKKKRKGRARKSLVVENNEHFEGYAENAEDEDLTVDDLMSIAKELVKEDKDAQPVVSLKHEHRVGCQSQNIVSRSSVSVPQGNIRSVEDRGTSSGSIPMENLTSEVAGCKQTMSGNPTQDMLDLFLGPLLKKTQEQEKEAVLVEEEINFTREVKKQHTGVLLGEEPVVVMKKKTSLKDKVAMFLD